MLELTHCEQCLVKAVQAQNDDRPAIAKLYKATYGMLLFGVPHKGLLVNDMQKMLAAQLNGKLKHPRQALLKQMKPDSDLLMSQLVDFRNLIQDRKVTSFYEVEQSKSLELVSERRSQFAEFVQHSTDVWEPEQPYGEMAAYGQFKHCRYHRLSDATPPGSRRA